MRHRYIAWHRIRENLSIISNASLLHIDDELMTPLLWRSNSNMKRWRI